MNYPQPPHPHHHHHRQQQQQPPPHPANSSHGGFSSFEDALQAHLKFNNEVLLQANATSNLNLPSSLVASSSSSSFTSTFTDQPLPSLTHSDQRSIKSHETQFIQSLTKTHNDIWTLPFVHDLNYLDSFDSTSYPVIYLFIISALLKSCMDGFLLIHSLFPRLMSFIRKVSSQTLHYAPSKVLELAELLFLVKDSLPVTFFFVLYLIYLFFPLSRSLFACISTSFYR
ncbi:hypothetical protein HMI55_004599 [Coelomomyces lativittatus]|nr:hypothetical protein HMI55_004599 [Coelomomyces lativittatus]KAJ1499623.1 hypothetical protein HMI56_004289 [Coelomomyces lativittatus]